MKVKHFKFRKYLDFSPHPFDVGNPFGNWKPWKDNHFLNIIYELEESRWADFYNYHLKYNLDNKLASEEEFYEVIWYLVKDRIKYYEDKSPFDSNHELYEHCKAVLRTFQKYLNTLDKWNIRPANVIIAEKDQIIVQQQQEIERLARRVAHLNDYEVAQKIRIEEEHLPTLIDIFKQMRALILPSGRRLLRCDNKSPYPKMISKYFTHAGKDIPIETCRNYFVDGFGEIPSKGTHIQPGSKLFKITKETEKVTTFQ